MPLGDTDAASCFLRAQGYTPLEPPDEQFPHYSYTKFAVDDGDEWEEWVFANCPDLPADQVTIKMGIFDAIQKAMYPLLADGKMTKWAFLEALRKQLGDMDDANCKAVFTKLSPKEMTDAFTLYESKKKLHDASKKEFLARGPREQARRQLEEAEEQERRAKTREAETKGAYFGAAGRGAACLAATCGLVAAPFGLPAFAATVAVLAGGAYGVAMKENGKVFRVVGYGAYKLPVMLRGRTCAYMHDFEQAKQEAAKRQHRKRSATAAMQAAENAHGNAKRVKREISDEDRAMNRVI
eukprot:Transcript_3989.p1 GENE.Transcript_3989~~Transcript_3989.p1  ORF type:complete len:296 (+),score=67.87 Transcript_3989:148-1035(+)